MDNVRWIVYYQLLAENAEANTIPFLVSNT